MSAQMFIAITGTPATGKSATASVLKERGYDIITVQELALRAGAKREKNCLMLVDIDSVTTELNKHNNDGIVFIVGHLAHLLPNKVCIVLRCSPIVLRKRLAGRKYSRSKLMENVEAEAIDLILIEALAHNEKVYEIDTTTRTPENVAQAIETILSGDTKEYGPGKIDWSREILSWY